MEDRVHIDLAVTPNSGTIGMPIQYQIKAKGGRVLPLEENSFLPFEVLSFTSETLEDQTQQLTYTLSAYDIGIQRIPTQQILIETNRDTQKGQLPAYEITYQSVMTGNIEEMMQIRPEPDPMLSLPRPYFAYVILGAALLCFAGAIAWRKWQKERHRRGLANEGQSQQKHPAIIARDALRQLQFQMKDGHRDATQFYERLSIILRTYLGTLYSAPFLESTTSEIALFLSKNAIEENTKRRILNVLESADWVKFAKWAPEGVSSNETLEKVEEIIRRTEGAYR